MPRSSVSVVVALQLVLGQQRHVVDHDPARADGRDGLLFELLGPLGHQRVHDRVELGQQAVVGEHQLTQPRPVQPAVREQDVGSEHGHDLAQARGTGLHHRARGHVGVDQEGAAFGEAAGHLALTGTDPAGEPDSQHTTS